MAKKVDIRSRMTPDWIQKGKAVLDKLTSNERDIVTAYMFNIILEDVKAGLRGEEADVFFEMIDQEFQKIHSGCYFSAQVDGNAVEFNANTNVCPLCAVKIKKVLQAFAIGHKKIDRTIH